MEITATRLLAVEYRCPGCGDHHASVAMTPTKRNREYLPTCILCDCAEEIVARRYYTLFASDLYQRAGTCASLGPFPLCHYVYPSIRAFRREIAAQLAYHAREAQA